MTARTVEVEGRQVRLTNLDKVLWPETGFTKGEMVDYYVRVAPALLPHLAGKPMTLHRFPDGVNAPHWYQTECPAGCPEWMTTLQVPARLRAHVHEFCVVNDLPSLVWVANTGAVELHPFLHVGHALEEPTVLVFDLDPGPPADILDCCEVALWVREALDEDGLPAYAKTTGGVGMHIFCPLARGETYDRTKAYARGLARRLEAEHPGRVVEKQARALRRGKVLVDWLQNDPTRQTVAPYSLRGTPIPTASCPVTWDEIESALAASRPELLTFEPADVLARLDARGDLFAACLPDGAGAHLPDR